MTTKGGEYVRTGFLKYVTVQRKAMENEAESCAIVGPLETLRRQAVSEMVESGMEDAGQQKLPQGRRGRLRESFITEERSMEMRWWNVRF